MADRVLRAPLVLTGRVFLYGTLLDPELFAIAAGAPLEARPAVLRDFAVRWVAGESFPVAFEHPGGEAKGAVVEVDDEVRARLDFYELGFGYRTEDVVADTASGPVAATIYMPVSEWPVGEPWSLADWQAAHGPLTRLAAREYFRLFGTLTPDDAAKAFPQIRMRAASRLRALDEPTPEVLAPGMAGRPVIPETTRQPYTDYFAVREDWLTFPKFGGGESPVVKRATFLGGDAVTVLPYDPRQGTVLMVRQFRHGAFARGDRNPWTLEPAAGRIDPGESPEAAARRELQEEVGLTVGDLHLAARYYPTPGAVSEYLFSYVASADLAGKDGTIGGVDGEAEDIMSHVIPLDEALGMIETGAINTGPLILSLNWLALNRERFG